MAHQPQGTGKAGMSWTRWMLWRDRRAPLSALIILCAYFALLLAAVDQSGQMAGLWRGSPLEPSMQTVLTLNAALLIWRLGMRAWFVGKIYGWRQGMASIPRAFVSNIIHMLAARRALTLYIRQLRSQKLVWDKTSHDPVATLPIAGAVQ